MSKRREQYFIMEEQWLKKYMGVTVTPAIIEIYINPVRQGILANLNGGIVYFFQLSI